MLVLTNFDPPIPCHNLLHISEPPKVRHTLELENLNDCPASICASELCQEHIYKLQLYLIEL